MNYIIASLFISTQLLLSVEVVMAKALTEKQIAQKVLCKHKQVEYKIPEEKLEDCMSGKYDISRYAECGKVDEGLYEACLISKASVDHKFACDSFNKKIVFNFQYTDDGCMETKATSLSLCYQKLENFGFSLSKNNDEFYLTGTTESPGGYWKGFESVKSFIKTCYSSEPQVFTICENLYKSKSVNSFEKCIKAKPTAVVINKCNTIISPKDPDEILFCLEEYHAVKIANETPGKVKAALSSNKRSASLQVHDGNRMKKNVSFKNKSGTAKSIKSTGKKQ